jgi:hypothetical protein
MTRYLHGFALLLLAGAVHAQVQGPGLTLPQTVERSFEVSPSIGLRGWVGGRPGLLASDGVIASSMVLADWHPLSSGFRVSGGLAYGSLRLDPVSTADIVGGSSSLSASTVDAKSWLRGSPYLGLGWGIGQTNRSGLYLSADLGVMYQRGSLSAWGCPGGIPAAPCSSDLRLESSLDDQRFTPMMSFGVGLRF